MLPRASRKPRSPVTILAIDTCLAACSAALIDGEDLVFDHSEAMTRGHQERLAPMIGELMARSKADFAAIRTIGVTIGPGSFTGLRVGLAFAKGLGLALGRPCAGVGTLGALAATAGLAGPTAAVIDAGRGNLYLQIFDDPPRPAAPRVLSLDGAAELLSRLPNIADLTLIGPGAGLLAAALPNVRRVPMAAPSAQAVAKLAARAPQGSLQPLYLRPPDAVAPR